MSRKSEKHTHGLLSESFTLDYGSAALDWSGKDVDERLDELSQRVLLDGAVSKQVLYLI